MATIFEWIITSDLDLPPYSLNCNFKAWRGLKQTREVDHYYPHNNGALKKVNLQHRKSRRRKKFEAKTIKVLIKVSSLNH